MEEPVPPPPKQREPFTWRARAGSFVFAFRGLGWLLSREHNAWIHLAFTIAICVAGGWWRIDRVEWALVVFAIGSVLAAEAVNTAFESLADVVKPEHDPLVGRAKDLAAAGVLLASIAAATIGAIVFGPYVWATIASWTYSSPSK